MSEEGLPTAATPSKKNYNIQETVSARSSGCDSVACLIPCPAQVIVDNVWQYVHIGAAAFLFYEDHLLCLYSLLGFASLCGAWVSLRDTFLGVLLLRRCGRSIALRRSDPHYGRGAMEDCHPRFCVDFGGDIAVLASAFNPFMLTSSFTQGLPRCRLDLHKGDDLLLHPAARHHFCVDDRDREER